MTESEGKPAKSQEIKGRAFREWELSVRQYRPVITDEEMHLLRLDPRDRLHLIITWHGADAALMLYPEDDRARRFFDDVDARGFAVRGRRAHGAAGILKSPTGIYDRDDHQDAFPANSPS